MAEDTGPTVPVSSGVDALIAKLRDEGVSAGRAEAERLVAGARAEARQILDKAEADAESMRSKARKDAQSYQLAGEEALKTAMRDTVLDMKAHLVGQFSTDLARLVETRLQDKDVLTRMILELVGRVRRDTGLDGEDAVRLVLPEKVVGLADLRNNPDQLAEGPIAGLTLELTRDMLREGVTFSVSPETEAGLSVQLADNTIEIDLTDTAIAGLLLDHLQPRFRAILEGIVK